MYNNLNFIIKRFLRFNYKKWFSSKHQKQYCVIFAHRMVMSNTNIIYTSNIKINININIFCQNILLMDECRKTLLPITNDAGNNVFIIMLWALGTVNCTSRMKYFSK